MTMKTTARVLALRQALAVVFEFLPPATQAIVALSFQTILFFQLRSDDVRVEREIRTIQEAIFAAGVELHLPDGDDADGC